MVHFVEVLMIAVMASGTYVLIALGFTLLFGAINIIQFAHGDVAMLGAFVALILYKLAQTTGITLFFPSWLWIVSVIVLTLIVIGGLGVMFERAVIKPLRGPGLPILMVLVSTVALGIFIRESVRLFYPDGANPQPFPVFFPQWGFQLGTLHFRAHHMIMIGIIVFTTLAMMFFINRTKIGLAIRAISQNIEAASLMGINTEVIIMVTFFVASVLAGVAGFVNGSYVKLIKFDIGLMGGIKGFTAAIVGGLGSFNGAILGGVTLGFVETFCSAYIPGGSPYKDVFGFLMVIFFLVFRPRGLLGEIAFTKV